MVFCSSTLPMQDVRKTVLASLPACETMVTEIVARARDVNHEVRTGWSCAAVSVCLVLSCQLCWRHVLTSSFLLLVICGQTRNIASDPPVASKLRHCTVCSAPCTWCNSVASSKPQMGFFRSTLFIYQHVYSHFICF